MSKNVFWNESRTAMLRKLYADGLSGVLIAERLGTTKGAVSGKKKRLGLVGDKQPKIRHPRRNQNSNRQNNINTEAVQKARAVKLKPELRAADPGIAAHEPEAPIECKRISILELNSCTCRFPIGVPGAADFCYCGLVPKAGSVYCQEHNRIAFNP